MLSATSVRNNDAAVAESFSRSHSRRAVSADAGAVSTDRIDTSSHARGDTQLISGRVLDQAHLLAARADTQVEVRSAARNSKQFTLEDRTYKAPTKAENFAFRAYVHDLRADDLADSDPVRSHYHRIVARVLRGSTKSPQAKSNLYTRLDTYSVEYSVNRLWNHHRGAAAFPLTDNDEATYSRYLQLGGEKEFQAFRNRIVAQARERTLSLTMPGAVSAMAISQTTGGIGSMALVAITSLAATFRYHRQIRNVQPQHRLVWGARQIDGDT